MLITIPKEKQILDRDFELQRSKKYWRLRRAQDILISVIALIVLLPVIIILSIIIYLDDPKGSPIFSQIRCGRDGKEFRFYKFRSMHVNAEERLEELLAYNEAAEPAFKMKDDPRITRIGKFIRKTSLDEIPQLWNVLRGEMSLVGPRPPLPREAAQYDEYQKQRLYVTPGITCYWQIQPKRNDLSFDEWMALDILYIKERSFITDWKILFGTIGAVLGAEGE